jgi:hypothetical protein
MDAAASLSRRRADRITAPIATNFTSVSINAMSVSRRRPSEPVANIAHHALVKASRGKITMLNG